MTVEVRVVAPPAQISELLTTTDTEGVGLTVTVVVAEVAEPQPLPDWVMITR